TDHGDGRRGRGPIDYGMGSQSATAPRRGLRVHRVDHRWGLRLDVAAPGGWTHRRSDGPQRQQHHVSVAPGAYRTYPPAPAPRPPGGGGGARGAPGPGPTGGGRYGPPQTAGGGGGLTDLPPGPRR